MNRIALTVVAFAAAFGLSAAAHAQNFPIKPVRIVIPFAPGGAVDTVGRMVAAKPVPAPPRIYFSRW